MPEQPSWCSVYQAAAFWSGYAQIVRADRPQASTKPRQWSESSCDLLPPPLTLPKPMLKPVTVAFVPDGASPARDQPHSGGPLSRIVMHSSRSSTRSLAPESSRIGPRVSRPPSCAERYAALKGYGKADVEWNVSMPADAMFEIGSITKQFTAVALLQLRDEGKLSLDDDIAKWLPDFDTRGNKLTLRRLLDHTSGIKGLTEMPEFGNLVNSRFPRDSAYALIKRYPFEFKTGEAQIYNNSAFWLLGLVVEKASGMTYEDYVEKKLFEPLGMKRSMYCNSAEMSSSRARYQVQNGVPPRATNFHTWPFSAGSLARQRATGYLAQGSARGKVLSSKSSRRDDHRFEADDGTPLGTRWNRGRERCPRFSTSSDTVAESAGSPRRPRGIRRAGGDLVLMNSNGNIDPGAVAGELAAGCCLRRVRRSQGVHG